MLTATVARAPARIARPTAAAAVARGARAPFAAAAALGPPAAGRRSLWMASAAQAGPGGGPAAAAAAAAPAGNRAPRPRPAPPAAPGTVDCCWEQRARVAPSRPPLREHARCDVAVVGGGLSGLTTALMCAKAGMSVILLESRAVGAGMSGRGSGAAPEWPAGAGGYARIESRHGFGACRQVARSRSNAFDWVEGTVLEERIDCGFGPAPGAALAPPGAAGAAGAAGARGGRAGGAGGAALAAELDACRRAGLGTSGSAAAGGAALPGRAAVLDPVLYAQGLARALERHGGKIYEGTRVKSGPFTISGKVATLASNSTDGPTVRAARGIVLATNSPINRSLAVHSRQSPWRTYSMAFELPEGAPDPPAPLLFGLDGRHARAVAAGAGRRLLLVGGGEGDHVVGQMRERYEAHNPYAALEAWARAVFPAAGRAVLRWSAVTFRPADLLGLYGTNPLDAGTPKTRIITGHGGDTVIGAAVAGLAVSGAIAGAEPEWAGAYHPGRLAGLLGSVGGLSDLATEIGLNVRGYARVLTPTCWRDVVGLVAPGRVERQLAPGDGAVVQEGLRKVALALCPHMHVLVQFNPLEKTFDCPGHGSVFDCAGRCVNGPSSRDLEDLGWRREAEGRGEGGGSLVK
ncbi:oxidoreductase [Raphidocelis subcapitata]|uniref:Oxidoreductase n=1 Tax=Raphidocelis subcapitata TaxID=307507 RepID=A0A2V0PHN6_9CHLO|nr:oxidoreductase [Raphidocelis subcapitata]|eukprot:GBF96757.1 oxidoreductase [Raphidocelis subcapitata]